MKKLSYIQKEDWEFARKWFWDRAVYFCAFLIPVFILLFVYIVRGAYPFGENVYLRMDFFHQYAPFMKEFWIRVREGKSLLYAWENGLGTNYWAQYAYYLASPFNWFYLLFPKEWIVEVMNAFLIIKSGLASLSFVFFLRGKYQKKDFLMAVFGCFYALSSFFLAYSCNVIWMDCLMLFPLVALGIEKIVKGESAKLYTVLFSFCIISNFYMAFIMGICCAFYFVLCMAANNRTRFLVGLTACLKMFLSTVLAVVICAVILFPVALALQHTQASATSFPTQWEAYFSFPELFERMLMNVEVVQNQSDLPNIYASVFVLLLFPLYFFNRKISIREKISYGILTVFLLFSFQWNVFDFIWHGFHYPNSFPAREAFFYILLILSMAYHCLDKWEGVKIGWTIATFILEEAGIIGLWFYFGKSTEPEILCTYIGSIVALLLYFAILLVKRTAPKMVFVIAFTCIAIVELGFNSEQTGVISMVSRDSYVDEDEVTQTILDYLREKEADHFYRVEEFDRKSVNDAGWDGYYGASYFSSTASGPVARFYEKCGLRISNVSYSYQGATPLMTSLLGVKYLIGTQERAAEEEFEVTEWEEEGVKAYLYENRFALSLGYLLPEGFEGRWKMEENPFMTQNNFVTAILGENKVLFHPFSTRTFVEPAVFDEENSDMTEEISEGIKRVITFEEQKGQRGFLYIAGGIDSIGVSITNIETGEIENRTFEGLKFKQILDLGTAEFDSIIAVSSGVTESKSIEALYAYYMDESVYEETIASLQECMLENVCINNTRVTASVNNKEKGTLFTSIPYETGWKVKVDGEEVQVNAFEEAFLSIELEPGEHTLEFEYLPEGYCNGIFVSGCGLAIAFLICIWKIRRKKRAEEQI